MYLVINSCASNYTVSERVKPNKLVSDSGSNTLAFPLLKFRMIDTCIMEYDIHLVNKYSYIELEFSIYLHTKTLVFFFFCATAY